MYKFTIIIDGRYHVSDLSFQTKEDVDASLNEAIKFLVAKCAILADGFVHMA